MNKYEQMTLQRNNEHMSIWELSQLLVFILSSTNADYIFTVKLKLASYKLIENCDHFTNRK